MNIIGIIPARMGSSRFPGKPMKPICGIPMVGHVYYRATMSKTLSSVYIATCDTEIADYIQSINLSKLASEVVRMRAKFAMILA